MNNVKSDYQAGRQIVVFDQIDATYPGGVHIDKTTAKKRFTKGVVPAGTMVMKQEDGSFKVFDDEVQGEHIGLTAHDIVIDDMPLVAVVMAGTARLEALPDKEQENKTNMKTCLPRISLV